MPTENTIDWNEEIKNEQITVTLADAEIGGEHVVEITRMFKTDEGAIGAEVRSETLVGNVLWLKGKFGFQNGFLSMLNAVDGDANELEGKSLTFTKVESEKSPVGYAFRWTLV
tara:strand:- start:36 stop:374 length:339 start_codon:yes stop_codon:yes gene_type:complete